jgi:hypothetical protein
MFATPLFCPNMPRIQKFDFEIRILKVLLLIVLIVSNWVQAFLDAKLV